MTDLDDAGAAAEAHRAEIAEAVEAERDRGVTAVSGEFVRTEPFDLSQPRKLPACAWCVGLSEPARHECLVCEGVGDLVGEAQALHGLMRVTGWSRVRVRAFINHFGQRWCVGAVRFAVGHGLTDPQEVGVDPATDRYFAKRPPLAAAEPPPAPPPKPPPESACDVCRGAGIVETLDGSAVCACQRGRALRARAHDARMIAMPVDGSFKRAVVLTVIVDATPPPSHLIAAAQHAAAFINQAQHLPKKEPGST